MCQRVHTRSGSSELLLQTHVRDLSVICIWYDLTQYGNLDQIGLRDAPLGVPRALEQCLKVYNTHMSLLAQPITLPDGKKLLVGKRKKWRRRRDQPTSLRSGIHGPAHPCPSRVHEFHAHSEIHWVGPPTRGSSKVQNSSHHL